MKSSVLPILVRVVDKYIPSSEGFGLEDFSFCLRVLYWEIFVVHDELQAVSGGAEI